MARYLVSVTVDAPNVFGALLAASKQFVGDEVALLTLAQTGAIAVKLVRSKGEQAPEPLMPPRERLTREQIEGTKDDAGAWDLEHA